jgi:hypothetical protein
MTGFKLTLAALAIACSTTAALANGQFIAVFEAAYDGDQSSTAAMTVSQIVAPQSETHSR